MPKVKPPAIVAKAPAQAVGPANLLMLHLSEIKQPLGRQAAELMRQADEYRRVLLGTTGAAESDRGPW